MLIQAKKRPIAWASESLKGTKLPRIGLGIRHKAHPSSPSIEMINNTGQLEEARGPELHWMAIIIPGNRRTRLMAILLAGVDT